MEYKKIIKSRELRLKILSFFDFIPDKQMIKIQYWIKTGRILNLKNPKRYTEKLQCYKLCYRAPLMLKCADKYAVREYVKSKGLDYILNDIYGVYENVEDINFDELPSQFVIKTTNGGGGNNVILCKNKDLFNKDVEKKRIKKWLHKSSKGGREWVYDFKPRVIAEKLLPRDKNNDLPDYKFYCFNGKVSYVHVVVDYVDNHQEGKLGFFDTDFNLLPYYRGEYKKLNRTLEKPKNFEKMLEISKILSEGFPHVRVDLYNIDGEIIFGELTFFTASGYIKFYPDEFDYILGKDFHLEETIVNYG